MSGNSILEQYVTRRPEELVRRGAVEPPVEDDIAEDMGCFGWLRGIKERAVMLELRKKDGGIIAVNYSWLERAEFDPSTGIALRIGGQIIHIKGRNLNAEIRPQVKLFHGIARHRVPWIAEATQAESIRGDKNSTVVEVIDF